MAKNLFLTIGGLCVLGGVVFLFTQGTLTLDRNTTKSQTENTDSENETKAFRSENFDGVQYSLALPQAVTASQLSPERYEFKYIGENNEPNTEITDGYTLTAVVVPTRQTLDEYLSESTNYSTSTIAGYSAALYTTVSELGNQSVTHYALRIGKEHILDFSYLVSGADSAQYEREVTKTIRSASATVVPKPEMIRLDSELEGETVSSPLTITGEARGYWFFEATFPVVITDWDGKIIAEHYATADGDWMTEDFVPFTATVEFDSPYTEGDSDFMQTGTVILQKQNASGLPENADAREYRILFSPVE